MSQGSSPSLHQNKIMSRLAFTTHLAKRDIHGLKASSGKLAKLKNKSRLAHVLDMAKRDTFHQSPSSPPSPKATFPSRFSQAKRDKHDNTRPSKHLGSRLAHSINPRGNDTLLTFYYLIRSDALAGGDSKTPQGFRASPSALDGVIATHKSLGPVCAQLHCIVNHILLPQSGSLQRVSFCDTLVLFALIMKVPISFGYLMMRHMHDCIRNEKLIAFPYGMFLTKIFESYCIDFHDEPYEESYSQLKGGGAVKRTVKGDLAAERRAMEEEEVAERASTRHQVKLLLHVVEELMAEVAFLTIYMYDMSKAYKSASGKSTIALEKSTERKKVLKKYVDKLRADNMFSNAEEEEEENEEDESEPSDA
ncbi:hypothetical protein PIB30_083853 [Stylosanthes scabra]|uniref:Uncharacterized protein n=1 Tax=Stylosanthes scabra TaxID=79078 RepID=A0ABU6RS95_9FABA|nr:hypothetical protein [Stylosanthes scabra]